MGNRIAAVSGSQNLGPTSRQSSLQRRSSHQGGGSSESLCTFFSLESHADQCLLKENDTDSSKPAKHKSSQLHEGIPLRARCSSSIFEDHQDDDGTSTIITTLEDIMSNDVEREKENSATDQNNEKLKIPESLLQKLTTEDWNDLVQFICSSMEQSLQSNILKEIEKLREKKMQFTSSDEVTIDNEKRQDEAAAILDSVSPTTVKNSHIRRTGHRYHRPLSMPPSVSSSQLIYDNTTKHGNHHDSRKHSHHRDSSKSPPLVFNGQTNELDTTENNKTKTRSSSNPHKVHFSDGTQFRSSAGGVWRSCSGSSLDELDLNSSSSKHKYLKKGHSRGYLTLDQLKALGLSLQQDSTKLTTSERLSSFSMKCWHGDAHYINQKQQNIVSSSTTTCEKRKRRHKKKSKKHGKHSTAGDSHGPDNQKPQFEQLCLLGPPNNTSSAVQQPSSSSPPPRVSSVSSTIPPTTDPNINDSEESKELNHGDGNQSCSGMSSSDDSIVTVLPADVKVEHLHQHSHHHYHHFIHHSISQPSGLSSCDKTDTIYSSSNTDGMHSTKP